MAVSIDGKSVWSEGVYTVAAVGFCHYITPISKEQP